VNLLTEVPDTLTTWYSEAYGLHSTTGLGVALRSQITVIKPFFVSLELPFSINFGEAVTITPLVFNLDRRMPKTTVSIDTFTERPYFNF
jgi:CD109 antigen